MSELKNALRAGDVWVPGSRQFRDFDEYLIEREAFTGQATASVTGLAVTTDAGTYLEERLATLNRELTLTNQLARDGKLPDVARAIAGDAAGPELVPEPITEFTPDQVLLFRFSALTFNAHRIHYDQQY